MVLVYFLLLWQADSADQATIVFGRTFYVLVMAFLPTSEVALILDLLMGTIGASIAVTQLRARVVGILVAFGFCWTMTNIIINWFTAPI